MRIKAPFERFIQIPSAGAVLKPGGNTEWDGGVIEACNVIKDENTYYLYYHGIAKKESKWSTSHYRLGVATASHPMGPWKKYEGNPILDLGPEGGWEDLHVACAAIIKEKNDKFYMWYSGCGNKIWSIGLATASSLLGPWTKHGQNPVLKDFGYVGSVIKVNNQYRMYSEHPVGASSPDQGPICLATAEAPEGPWKKYEGNPVIAPDDWGAWDDGGYSEAGVLYHDGLYHVFYSGTKWRKLETIGYAWSEDGIHFTKHPHNPVVLRERVVDCSAMAEVHALWEYPVFYLFHTGRYFADSSYEDIGVQAVAVSTPFQVRMPVAVPEALAGEALSGLEDCPPICLEQAPRAVITVECRYHERAKSGVRLHVRSSVDGLRYDTTDWATLDLPCTPGELMRKTVVIPPGIAYAKLLLENTDSTQPVCDIRATAVLGCEVGF